MIKAIQRNWSEKVFNDIIVKKSYLELKEWLWIELLQQQDHMHS